MSSKTDVNDRVNKSHKKSVPKEVYFHDCPTESTMSWWSNYKQRFTPWSAVQLLKSVHKSKTEPANHCPNLKINTEPLKRELLDWLHLLCERQPSSFPEAQDLCLKHFGFLIHRSPSQVCPQAGTGVLLKSGSIKAGRLAAIYPGTIYKPGQPTLLASLGNSFMFRCADGILLDGNDRRTSRMIYKSCAGRDSRGAHEVCDLSWLAQYPINALNIGQYINDGQRMITNEPISDEHDNDLPIKSISPNVTYEELDLNFDELPFHSRKYLPYVFYNSDSNSTGLTQKVVILVALRDICEGEELLSSYFTIRDSSKVLKTKCRKLAELVRKSRCVVVFTGAGISTSASIPDYRGPNGIWTLAEQGKSASDVACTSSCDPIAASPTPTHLALREMYRCGFIRHVLSQNCDGLHLRSGLPQQALSEIHGNMYVEVCTQCEPNRQYIRTFDVTERTSFRRHKTSRRCDWCNQLLTDSIVHFGEWGKLLWPLNWKGATSILNSDSCDLVIVLGSSLQILKQYDFLWANKEQAKYRNLAIVNLQKTPKDRVADLVIHGECDVVMRTVMQHLTLNMPPYCRLCDPVLHAKRRNAARAEQLMTRIAQCHCSGTKRTSNINSSTSDDTASTHSSLANEHATGLPLNETPRAMPGWWGSGFVAKHKKRTHSAASSNSQFGQRRKRGRPSKSVTVNGALSNSCSATDQEMDDYWSESDDLPLFSLTRNAKSLDSESKNTDINLNGAFLDTVINTVDLDVVNDVLSDLIDGVILGEVSECALW